MTTAHINIIDRNVEHAHIWINDMAQELSHRLPLAPGCQAAFVIVLGDTKWCRAEEHPQRRRVGVDDAHDRCGRGGRVTRHVARAPLLLALAECVVDGVGFGALGR